MIVHQNQMQVLPVPPMSTADRLAQVNFRKCLLIPLQQLLHPRVGHRMVTRLLRDVLFDHASCRGADTANGVVSLEGFWLF